jgi:hypothetical protein
MMEMSRDNKHDEDIVARLMFETLCEGNPSSLSRACLKSRSLAKTAARAGEADPSRTK